MNYNKILKKDLISLLKEKDNEINRIQEENYSYQVDNIEDKIMDLEDKIIDLEQDVEIRDEMIDKLDDFIPFALPKSKIHVDDIRELSDYELERIVDLLNHIREILKYN